MATYTENYNLEMPDQNDFYNIDVQNQNMQKIDTALAAVGNNSELEGNVAELVEKVGTTTDVGGSDTTGSVMGKLNAMLGMGAVKSVQRGTTTGATTVTIAAVDMAKSIVISRSKGSAGYVAARGSISGSLSGDASYGSKTTGNLTTGSGSSISVSLSGTRTLSGGTTDLTVKEYSAQLTSDTTIKTDGPVEWQVVEYR